MTGTFLGVDPAQLSGRDRQRFEIAERAASLPAVAARLRGDRRLPAEFTEVLAELCRAGLPTLAPLCAPLLRLNDRPYTLDEHFLVESLFRTRMPKHLTLKAGRQIAKSTTLAAQGIISSMAIPGLVTLYMTPLYELTRRFSTNYVRRFIEESPFVEWLRGDDQGSVLERQFSNGSRMHFSFAMENADRTRGIPASRRVFDEVQDAYLDVLKIADQTLGGSQSWGLRQDSGTPKSFDGPLQVLWEESSQAEWLIKCPYGGCGHWNIPAAHADLLDMIGPWHRDVGRGNPGLVCAKCRKPLDPRTGHWFHFVKDKRYEHEGLHLPQILFPHHCEDPEAWGIVCEAQACRGYNTEATLMNEVLGESCDLGHSLLSETDLKRASCLPWPCKAREAAKQVKNYQQISICCDWGGGGGVVDQHGKSTRVSFTSIAVLGTNGNGKIDVLWGHRSLKTHDKMYEAGLVKAAMKMFRAKWLVHDYSGGGDVREAILVGSGLDINQLVAVRYHGPASKAMWVRHPGDREQPRPWHSLDKSRSLGVLCQSIKFGLVRFFQWSKNVAETVPTAEFTSLFEERFTSLPTSDTWRVATKPRQSDDFCQAVNIGAAWLWHITDSWPNLGNLSKYELPADIAAAINAAPVPAWDDI